MARHEKNEKHDRREKHAAPREVIRLSDYRDREETASVSYEEPPEEEAPASPSRVPKAVYRVALILLALVLVLALWMNRERLTPAGIADWVKVQFMGSGEGEGFPVPLTGTQVSVHNFTAAGPDALILSNTSLTRLDDSGKDLFTTSHGFSAPVLRAAGSCTLLYDQGGDGFRVYSGTQRTVEGPAESDILTGAVAPNGRYALGLQTEDGASQLQVFLEDGSLQYRYLFSKGYLTAVALDPTGTRGLACTVYAREGQLISQITVLDFSSEEPLAQVEVSGTLLADASWGDGGMLYALGDDALYAAKDSQPDTFTPFSYGGRYLTAYDFGEGRAVLSVSPYEHGGSSTLMAFHGPEAPVQMDFSGRITDLSLCGSVVGALADGQAVFCDYAVGTQLGSVSAGPDAKSLALSNERSAYVLGVSEIRRVTLE